MYFLNSRANELNWVGGSLKLGTFEILLKFYNMFSTRSDDRIILEFQPDRIAFLLYTNI